MKKIFLIIAIAGIACLTISCGKETVTTGPPSEEIINVSLPRDASYTYNLGTYGRDRTPVITRQPSNYLVSRIIVTEGGNAVYNYQPAEGFTGDDEVVIQITRETNGVDPMRIVNLRIKFSVRIEQTGN